MKNYIKVLFKNIFANKCVQFVLAWMCHFYIFIVYKTSKIKIIGNYKEILDYNNKCDNSIILFTWHGRITIAPIELKKVFSNKKLSALASAHRDGQIAGNIMSTFGMDIIAGSSIDYKKGSNKNKKSLTSIRNIMRVLSCGRIFVFAVDGPRGPAFKINTKITNIAKVVNAPIVGVSISYKNKKIFNTWDKFELPLPFTTILAEYGTLLHIKDDDDVDKINAKLEEELNQMTKKNDKEVLNL